MVVRNAENMILKCRLQVQFFKKEPALRAK
jgi:hypothetical protein